MSCFTNKWLKAMEKVLSSFLPSSLVVNYYNPAGETFGTGGDISFQVSWGIGNWTPAHPQPVFMHLNGPAFQLGLLAQIFLNPIKN
jgi:hypothetical protein